ncbi:MAG TPA: ester cyclase [Chitinophagaceae bacterium]|nr:ester cyclase [Chitinophagaceae bacterium]
MKQILSLFTIGLAFVLVSCGNDKTASEGSSSSSEKKDNSMVEKNLAATRTVTKAFETGDVSMIDSVVASDFVDHTERGDKNRDSLKAMIVASYADSKDSKTEVLKELADNDYVFSWLRFTGTTSGKMGMPAGPYDMNAIELVKFKNGMAVEHWSFMQPKDMMKMMAQMGQMGEQKKK